MILNSISTLTVPQLELCGAILLANLLHNVTRILKFHSLVVLGWLQGSPRNCKTFVGNRVSTIIELIPPDRWHDVSGKDNLADCASRGIFPTELRQHKLRWKDPQWLEKSKEDWPAEPIVTVSEPLEEKITWK